MHSLIKCCLTAMLLLPAMAGEPSFDLDDEKPEEQASSDRTLIISSVDDLALQGVTGHGANNVQRAAQKAFKENPKGTRLRVRVGRNTEGSIRWVYSYPRSVTPLDAENRPHGVEWLLMHLEAPTGRIISYRLIPWKHGSKEGVEKEFLEEKPWGRHRLAAEVSWKNGKMHGLRKVFFPSSKIRSETKYVNGVADGLARIWDAKGNLLSTCTMKNGKRQGETVEYWPGSKQPARSISYQNGVTHGLVREYYRNGKLKRERAFRLEMAHGEDRIFNEKGVVIHKRYWFDGDPVSKEEFEKRTKMQKEK